MSSWRQVCALEDIYSDTGVCALLEGQQVAVFRVRGGVFAIGNRDPASGANVLSRGIVGDLGSELVVASPIYKQHFSLVSGRCLEEPELSVPVHLARIVEDQVWVRMDALAPRGRGKRRPVVIGSGVAAMRTIEELLELDPQAYDILVFGAEAHQPYNRVLLSSLLSGEKRSEDLVTHAPQWFVERGITLHCGDAIVRIDRARRTPARVEPFVVSWYGFALTRKQLRNSCLFISRRPDLASRSWLASLFQKEHITSAERANLLAGRPADPAADSGAAVCACFGVGRNAIETAIRAGCEDARAIGKRLKAGTNCGSCVPELNRMLAAYAQIRETAAAL